MRKVLIFETDKVVEVSNNVAFGIVDSGKGTLDIVRHRPNRAFKADHSKKYRTR